MNLLEETIKALEDNGKSTVDVEWIGCNEFKISLADFMRLANVEYDEGFGLQNVAKDLVLVGEDFYLERLCYDGSEKWVMKMIPKEPSEMRPITSLISKEGWETLKQINEEE